MPLKLHVCLGVLVVACIAYHASTEETPKAVTVDTVLSQFRPSNDIPQQRQALLALFEALGRPPELLQQGQTLSDLGYAGNSSWDADGTSYCWWWGVTCCGSPLYMEMQVCSQFQSVSSIELAAVGLNGRLPDIFQQLPDLQVLLLPHNRGLQGPLPDSLGGLARLWRLNILGTNMRCDNTTQQPAPCPLPSWLVQQRHRYYYELTGLECPVLQFVQERDDAEKLALIYRGAAQPEVLISDVYYGLDGCMAPIPGLPGFLNDNDSTTLPPTVLVIVILVPSLAVSVGLVLLSVALMRYLRYLKRSHDAIHLTEAWKRRNPPGLISDGNDRVLREVTLVITDVEGSTELWEWDYGVMTLAQEVHDSVMRSLIGRYCGYEVTTEGDSFTIAFHDAFDAVCWSLAMQQAMLEAEWPDRLLTHDKAGVVFSTASDSSRPGQLLFRGLRVRVAISTGIPSLVYAHELTNTLMYAGPVMDMAAALADLPAGGQILLGPQTFSSIAPRLAELGVRLMLTETEAAATAAAAAGHGSSHHHHTPRHLRGSTSQHFDRRQSVLAKTLSSTAAFWGGGRQNVLSTLAHEDDSMFGQLNHTGSSQHKQQQQQQQASSTPFQQAMRNDLNSKDSMSTPFTQQQAFNISSDRPAGSSRQQLHHSSSVSGSRGAADASSGFPLADGPLARRSKSWWPGWLSGRSVIQTQRRSGSFSHSSGGVHSSGGLSLHHSSSGVSKADPERGLGSVPHMASGRQRISLDKGPADMVGASAVNPHSAAIQDNEHIPMVIDLGSHWLDGFGNAIMPGGNPTAALQGVRLTQIVTRQLAPRAAHFPALATARQIYPSFFQAPCASEALLPDGLVFSSGALPVVTIVFCAPDQAGLRPVEASSKRACKQALEMFCSAVRTTLNACQGYECQEKDGIFMLAFSEAAAAVEWACVLNLALMCIHWAPEVLSMPAGREVMGPGGELLYRGIKARVGIYKGEITRIIPHRATGRADYFGPPVNRAARFLAASAPGQILAERSLVEGCVQAWSLGDLQAKLESRAAHPQHSLTDSLPSRHLSNTSTALGTSAAATAAASEAGDIAGRTHYRQPSQDPVLSSEPSAQQPFAQPDAAAAAAAAAAGVGSARNSSSVGGGPQQQRSQPKASFSFGLAPSQGASPDRAESCQLVLPKQQVLHEHQPEEMQQLLPVGAVQSGQQQHDTELHDTELHAASQQALAPQLAEQQLQPARASQVSSFGSPFSSAEKLPSDPFAAAAAAAAAGNACGGEGAQQDSDGSASVAFKARDSSSSTESARMARQATLSAMLRQPSSGASSSADVSPAALDGTRSTSGSGHIQLRLNSSAGGQALPTLFEAGAGTQQQQAQQQDESGMLLLPQPEQEVARVGSTKHSGMLSPAPSSVLAGVRVGRLSSDLGASRADSMVHPVAPGHLSMHSSAPLQEEMYAGFEDASSDDAESDAGVAGESSMVSDPQPFMQPPDASLSARAGSRIRSMFNMNSSRSIGSGRSISRDTVDPAPPGLLKARYSSLSVNPSAGPRGRSGFSTPGGVVRTTSTFSSGMNSQPSHTAGVTPRAPSSTAHRDLIEFCGSSITALGNITQSGGSFTTPAAALAAAVYGGDALCRPASVTALRSGSGRLSDRAVMLAEGPAAQTRAQVSTGPTPREAASLDPLPFKAPVQQQQQQQLQPDAAYVPSAPRSARAHRHSWAETGGQQTADGVALTPRTQQQRGGGVVPVSSVASRRYSWSETLGTAAAAAAAAAAADVVTTPHAQQGVQWEPAGLYGLLQGVQRPSCSPERPPPPKPSLAEPLQWSPEQQQQQSARQQPGYAGLEAVRSAEQLAPETAEQQQLEDQCRQQQQQQKEQEQGQQPGLHVRCPPPQPTAAFSDQQQQQQQLGPLGRHSSPSSAFASVASVSWEQPLRLSTDSDGHASVAAAARPSTEALCASSSVKQGGLYAAPLPAARSSSLQRQLLLQRSLQDRSSTPVRVPSIARQLSLPPYSDNAAAAAAAASTGARGSTVSSIGAIAAGGSAHSGAVLSGQVSLYGGGGPTPAEVLTGALPLEALPALRIGRMNKHQSFMLQAIKDQVNRSSVQRRVPMLLQVYDIGTWTFKGISGTHPVVVLLPSRLAGRMLHAPVKKSSKAVCVEASEGLLHELWLDVINIDTILLDPELLLSAGLVGQGQMTAGPAVPAGAPTAVPSTAASVAGAASGWVPGVGGGGDDMTGATEGGAGVGSLQGARSGMPSRDSAY